MCQKRLFTPKLTSLPSSAVIDFVKQGLGIAVMLKSVAQRIHSPDICLADIDASPIINVNLMYLKKRNLSPAARHFLEFLRTGCRKNMTN